MDISIDPGPRVGLAGVGRCSHCKRRYERKARGLATADDVHFVPRAAANQPWFTPPWPWPSSCIWRQSGSKRLDFRCNLALAILLPSDEPCQPRNPRLDLRFLRQRVAEPQRAAASTVVKEGRARYEGNAGLRNGPVEQIGRVDGVGQPHPGEETAL